MTFRERVAQRIQTSGDQVFLIDASSGRELTYREFHAQAIAFAAYLRSRGVRRGDRVATAIPNCVELAVVYFGILYCGATIVLVNPNLSVTEADYILQNSRPCCIVVTPSVEEKLGDAAKDAVILSVTHESVGTPDAANGSFIVLDRLPSSPEFEPLANSNDDHLALVVYTSGTTAKPKGLAHRIGSLVRNATVFAEMQNIGPESRFYLTLSMAYMGGLYNLLMLPFLTGASVVVDHVFDARSSLTFWEKVKSRQVNTLWLAPTVLSILLRMDRGRTGEQFCRSSVKKTFVGFAPLPAKVKEDFEKRYGVALTEGYGLSETLFVTARTRPGFSAPGYVGEALPGIEMRICNDDGSQVAAGEEGEIRLVTPDLMAGYFNELGELKMADAATWFSTGDFGRLDGDGSLAITGRKKDLIIRGGVNISPAAIEEVLLRAPRVSDAAVVSVPHEIYGEDIVAILKLEAGVDLDSVLEPIMKLCKDALASHQQPSRYIAIDEFPRTSNGKIQKSRLRELVLGKLQLSVSAQPVVSVPQANGIRA